jgi:hypothetical protein
VINNQSQRQPTVPPNHLVITNQGVRDRIIINNLQNVLYDNPQGLIKPEITLEYLGTLKPDQQREVLGERIHELLFFSSTPDVLRSKITGMILEIGLVEIFTLLQDRKKVFEKAKECYGILLQHEEQRKRNDEQQQAPQQQVQQVQNSSVQTQNTSSAQLFQSAQQTSSQTNEQPPARPKQQRTASRKVNGSRNASRAISSRSKNSKAETPATAGKSNTKVLTSSSASGNRAHTIN